VACSALRYFFKLSDKQHDFRGKKVIEYKMLVLNFFATLSETFLIEGRAE